MRRFFTLKPTEETLNMSKTKILFINTEVTPYLPACRHANIGRYLPQQMQEAGHEIRLFMPRFGAINERRNQLHEVIRLSGMNLIINEVDHPLIIKVASIQQVRMQVYFIDNDVLFTSRKVFGDDKEPFYADNAERCAFFARGVIETIRKLRWRPDVVYCQGWFAAIAPLYIRKSFGEDPYFRGVKVVFDVNDNEFDGALQGNVYHTVKRDGVLKNDILELKENPVNLALCQLALKFSDGLVITDATPTAAVLREEAERRNLPILDATDPDTDSAAYDVYFESFNDAL